MKTKKLIFIGMVFLMIGCTAKEKSAQEMLAESAKQEEVFDAILSDSVKIQAMLTRMQNNQRCRRMMHDMHMKHLAEGSDTAFISRLMDPVMMDTMVCRMAKDSVVCSDMCNRMTNRQEVKERLQKILCPMCDPLKEKYKIKGEK